MYAGKDFSRSDPQESESYTFDFVKDVAAGETIVSAEWECVVAADSTVTDSDPASRLVGVPANSGTKSSQRLENLVAGVKYRLLARVTTSAGNEISLWSHVACLTPD